MKKILKKTSIIIAFAVAFTTMVSQGATFAQSTNSGTETQTVLQTEAESETELENPEESLGLYNSSDGSEEGVNWQIQQSDPDGPVFEGLVSDDTTDFVNDQIDYILNGKTFKTSEITQTLGKISKSKFNLEENALDLVDAESVDNSNGQSGYIYVVDENAAVFLVKDEDGNYLSGANVTISYVNDDGEVVTRTVTTSDGDMPGVAAFDNMKGTRYGVLDITAEGYHSATLLEQELTGGDKQTFSLIKSTSDNEVYVRGVDLDGKDLINSDTTIDLFTKNVDQMTFSILVSETGNAKLPTTVSLRSKSDGRTVATFNDYQSYETGSGEQDTYIFTYKGNWVMQNKDLLEDGDELEIVFGSDTYDLSQVTVENCIVEPHFSEEEDLPIAGGDDDNTDSVVPIKGVDKLKFGLSLLNFKVSVAYMADGSFMVMAMKDIEGSKASLNELMPETTSPKTAEQTKGLLDYLSKAYKKSVEALKQSYGTLKSQTKLFKTYDQESVVASYGICLTCNYDKKTKEFTGDLDFIIQANGSYSKNLYCAIAAGPVVIPAYIGLELSLGLKTDFDIGITTPSITGPYSFSGKSGNLGIHVLPGVAAYLGVGIRGLLGADIQLDANLDLCAYVINRDNEIGTLDGTADFRLNYYYVLGGGSVNFITTGKKRLYPKSKLVEETENDETIKAIDLTDEQIIKQVAAGEHSDEFDYESSGGGVTLPEYAASGALNLTSSTVNGTQTINQIATNAYIDDQVQLVDTEDYAVMFRLVSYEYETKLMFQTQSWSNGVFTNALQEVIVPNHQSVLEYNAVPVRTTYKGARKDYIYIAAVIGDATMEDLDQRARTTAVVGIVIDLLTHKEVYCKVLAPKDGTYHFNPQPAGYMETCTAAYCSAASYKDRTNYTSYMVNSFGSTVKIGEKTPFYTTGNSGSLTDPAFWFVNKEKSDDNTAKLEAYNFLGTVPDSWTCHADLDVSGYELEDGEDYITSWCYEDSVNYFIAMGKVYYLEKYNASGSSETGPYVGHRVTELTYNGGQSVALGGTGTNYQFFSNHKGSAIYIMAAKPVYSVTNEETLDAECIGTQFTVYSIMYGTDDGKAYVGLHGTKDLFIAGEKLTSFSAAFTHKTNGSGMIIVYNKSSDNKSNDIYEWQENADEGMIITGFEIQDPVVTNTQGYIAAKVTIKNIGYKTGGLVAFKITDSSGTQLTEASYKDGEYTDLPADTTHYNSVVYPDDSDTYMIYFKTNPDWKTNESETINIEIVKNGVDSGTKYTTASAINDAVSNGGSVQTYGSSYSLTFDEPYLELSGKQSIVNGRHIAEISIENSSVREADDVQLAVMGVYSGEDSSINTETDLTTLSDCLKTVELGSSSILNRNVEKGKYNQQSYNLDVDLESIWKANKDNELMGVNLYLVDENGNKLDRQVVYLANPYYEVEDPEPETETEEETTEPETTEPETTTAAGNNSNSNGNNNSAAKTGDVNSPILWIILAGCAFGAGTFAFWKRKNKTH